MGAWIEIYNYEPVSYKVIVAPLVGAWIEILTLFSVLVHGLCRSSRGSVD